MKAVKKYSTGGTQEPPEKAIARRIKELRSEISVANKSRFANEDQRQQAIRQIQGEIKRLESKLASLSK